MKRKCLRLLFTGGLTISMVMSLCFNNINEVMAEELNNEYTYNSIEEKDTDNIYLSDIDYDSKSYAWGGGIKKDINHNGGKIRLKVDGKITEFNKGMAAHAESMLLYDVSKYSHEYTRLSMYMGVDYSQNGKGDGVNFNILTSRDGIKWETVKLVNGVKASSDSVYVNLNIKGIKYLKLYADKNGNVHNDHVVYGDLKISKNHNIEAQLDQSRGGIMLSTSGRGLRFFASLDNVNPNEAASYYITTASNKNETSKFEVKATVIGRDYSKIKASLEFSELSKLDENIDTKLYIKRVKNGQEPIYTEILSGDVDLTNDFNISDDKISVSLSRNTDDSLKLRKSVLNENSFSQGLSNIDWTSKGMVISGMPLLNGNSSGFENANVSILLKDDSGNYIQDKGKNVEIRGVCKDGRYELTIPYAQLNNVKTFELKIIGANYQSCGVLIKGDLKELKSTIMGNNEYSVSTDSNNAINLNISKVEQRSKLSNISVTTNLETNSQQFSINGNLYGGVTTNIKSGIKYTLIARKGEQNIFEQLMTRVKDSKGSYSCFKTNIPLEKLLEAELNQNDEVFLYVKVEYLGVVKELKLNSDIEAVSIKDSSNQEKFKITSKDGNSVIIKL